MNKAIKDKWDKHYQNCSVKHEDILATEVLIQNAHLLPESGTALDLACGIGANAIVLAEQSLTTSAWDISSSALEKLAKTSKEKSLNINIENRDVSTCPPHANSFDVIVVSRFLDRKLIPKIKDAIKTKGLVYYQTFTKEKVNHSGPSNPDYLLDENELLNFFNDWNILFYKEEGKTGNTNIGFRNQAMIVAEKPKK